MPFLPGDPVSLLALLVILAGTAYLLASKWPKAYGLGIIILLVFGLQMYGRLFRGVVADDPFTGAPSGDPIVDWLGFRAQPFLEGKTWWSPLSYLYVHADFVHLFGNLFILLTAGPVLEDRIGSKAFLWVFYLGGLAAAGVHLLLATVGPEPRFVGAYVPAIGASGAIFAVLTTVAILYPKERLPMTTGFFLLWLPAIAVLALYAAFNLAYMASDLMRGRGAGIAWYGHFAGLSIGLIAAALLEKHKRPASSFEQPGRTTPSPAISDIDIQALRPLATTRDLQEMLGKIEGMQGTTWDDAAFRDAWLDRFFQKARCPRSNDPLKREGHRARCGACGYELDFRAKKGKRGLF